MTPRFMVLVVLSCSLSFAAALMALQRQFKHELSLVALGAITGWSAVVCRGRLPAWIRDLWGDRIAADSAPGNLPVRIWFPILAIVMVIAALLVFYVGH